MMQESRLDLAWWIWWSNPLHAIHREHLNDIPQQYQNDSACNFSTLLGLRSLLMVPEVPEQVVICSPLMKSVCMASASDRHAAFSSAAALTLESEVLKYNANEWLLNLGVDQPQTVRELIQHWSIAPTQLKNWGEEVLQQHQTNNTELTFTLEERSDLILAYYFRNCAPKVFKRWRLTVPQRLSETAANTPPMDEGLLAALAIFLQPPLNAIEQKVQQHTQGMTENEIAEGIEQHNDEDGALLSLLNRISEVEDQKNA